MTCCRRQIAEGGGNCGGSEGRRGCGRGVVQVLGYKRCGGDGGGAAATQEADFSDTAVLDAGREAENVAADGIADFDGVRGAGKFAGVARMAEVIEDDFAIHCWKSLPPQPNKLSSKKSFCLKAARCRDTGRLHKSVDARGALQ